MLETRSVDNSERVRVLEEAAKADRAQLGLRVQRADEIHADQNKRLDRCEGRLGDLERAKTRP